MLATSPSTTIVDSWSRSPDADLRPDQRTKLLEALDAEEAAGRLTGIGRMLRAICFCGTSAPLARLAAVMGVCREHAGRIWKEAEEREIGRSYETPRNFGACTHVEDAGKKGHAGRAECEALRREAGLEHGGCSAHHGHKIRTLVDGLTPAELLRRLRRPVAEVKARLASRTLREEAKRKELGTPANDLEAKRWAGLPVERGPKGTNHVRPRKSAHVTPIPDLPLKDPETSASSEPGGVTFDSELRPTAVAGGAPTAPDVVTTHNEPSPPPTAPIAPRESCGDEDRERIVPTAKVFPMSAGRITAKIRDWFCREWMGRGLGPLNASDMNRLWVVCERELTREELALALEGATRLARTEPRKLFVRVFGRRAELHECVHNERMRRLREDSKGKRGGAPQRGAFDEARPGGTAPDQSARGGGAAPAPPTSPVRPISPPVVELTPEERVRRRDEQHAILLALIAEELVEIPIVGDVK
jgi:hypothetical protein